MDNFQTMLNYVHGKDGWAYIRHDGENEDVPLTQWAKAQCLARGCDEFTAETPEEIDEAVCACMMDCPDCPIALAYCFTCQAVHLRDRLMAYEDILFSEDGAELISMDKLQDLRAGIKNEPLTLDELREMVGQWVWVVVQYEHCECSGWAYVPTPACIAYLDQTVSTDLCGKKFKAYRRKPEEVQQQ